MPTYTEAQQIQQQITNDLEAPMQRLKILLDKAKCIKLRLNKNFDVNTGEIFKELDALYPLTETKLNELPWYIENIKAKESAGPTVREMTQQQFAGACKIISECKIALTTLDSNTNMAPIDWLEYCLTEFLRNEIRDCRATVSAKAFERMEQLDEAVKVSGIKELEPLVAEAKEALEAGLKLDQAAYEKLLLEREVAQLRAAKAALEHDMADLKSQQALEGQLRESVTKLQAAKEVLTKEKEETEPAVNEAKRILSATQGAIKEEAQTLNSYRLEVNQHRDEVARLKKSTRELQDQMTQLSNQNRERSTQQAQLTESVTSLKAQATVLHNEVDTGFHKKWLTVLEYAQSKYAAWYTIGITTDRGSEKKGFGFFKHNDNGQHQALQLVEDLRACKDNTAQFDKVFADFITHKMTFYPHSVVNFIFRVLQNKDAKLLDGIDRNIVASVAKEVGQRYGLKIDQDVGLMDASGTRESLLNTLKTGVTHPRDSALSIAV